MKKIILTGDRPTGKLHIGHYVGSLKKRVELQDNEELKQFIMIADSQALTDNFDNPKKIQDNLLEVMLDYLAVGIDPKKSTIFIQSEISELTELAFYYMNLVNLSRLLRNPTVKEEVKLRGFENNIPMGFLTYPVSQAADITAFKASFIPVGDDQLPMIEQTREIVRTFNRLYKEVLIEPVAVLPDNKESFRLPGIDGNAKMSKSLGNGIYLSDTREDLYKKVMKMYTDSNHIRIEDPGHIENNIVFTYLDVFVKEDSFSKYLPEYKNLDELKNHYKKGGLGDVVIKKFLFNVLDEELSPIRERRLEYLNKKDELMKILEEGTKEARRYAKETLKEVKEAMMLNYFEK